MSSGADRPADCVVSCAQAGPYLNVASGFDPRHQDLSRQMFWELPLGVLGFFLLQRLRDGAVELVGRPQLRPEVLQILLGNEKEVEMVHGCYGDRASPTVLSWAYLDTDDENPRVEAAELRHGFRVLSDHHDVHHSSQVVVVPDRSGVHTPTHTMILLTKILGWNRLKHCDFILFFPTNILE